MLHIIAYIISSLVCTILSTLVFLGIFTSIFIEMKGLGDYMYALIAVILGIIELVWFIGANSLDMDLKSNLKNLFASLKSPTKKESSKQKDSKSLKTKHSLFFYLETIILIAIAVYSVIFPQHSFFFNIIYNNFFVQILTGLLFPLIIINTLNLIVEKEGIIESLKNSALVIVVGSLFALIISSSMLLVAEVWYKDIAEDIKSSWFIYDNNRYDELRKSPEFKDEETYLKNYYEKILQEVISKSTCDINEPNCLDKIKTSMTTIQGIEEYGYKYSKKVIIDDNSDFLCLIDLKTKKYIFYKINYQDFAFEKSTIDEYNSYATKK